MCLPQSFTLVKIMPIGISTSPSMGHVSHDIMLTRGGSLSSRLDVSGMMLGKFHPSTKTHCFLPLEWQPLFNVTNFHFQVFHVNARNVNFDYGYGIKVLATHEGETTK